MAPVVYLPGLSGRTVDHPFDVGMEKNGTCHAESMSEMVKDTPAASPTHLSVRTPAKLWPETPEPSDAQFVFFFPTQGQQVALPMMVPSVGQHVQAYCNIDAPVGLPLQVLHSVIADSSAYAELDNMQDMQTAIETYEGDEFGLLQPVDAGNFSFDGAAYEEESCYDHSYKLGGEIDNLKLQSNEQALLEESLNAQREKELLHKSGQCRPCAWFYKKSGCQNEERCSYCHLCPEGELKARKKEKVSLMRSGALEPKRSSAQSGAARHLKIDPLVTK